jgi:hypothetical protein
VILVERELVHLEVTGVQHQAAAVLIATAKPSGIEWFTARNSQSNGPNRSGVLPRPPWSWGDAVLLELRLR